MILTAKDSFSGTVGQCVCGNGAVENLICGEVCDDGGTDGCCAADCLSFDPAGKSCNGGAGTCDGAGTCVGGGDFILINNCGNGNVDDGELCDDIAADDCCAKGCGAFEQNGTSCNGGDGTCDGAGTCQPNSNGVGDQGDDGSAANGGSDPIQGGGCVKAPTGSLMGVGPTSFTLSHLFWAGSLTGLWLLRRRKGA